jgi:hypothetical protein
MDGLEYVDIHHVYPVTSGLLDRAAHMVRIARARCKPVIVGEARLYKASRSELRWGAASGPIFARDVFDFWAPLDQAFIETIMRWASAKGVEFLSFFWSKYFFAYVDYAPAQERLSPVHLLHLTDAAAVASLLRGELSSTGIRYRTLIAAYALAGAGAEFPRSPASRERTEVCRVVSPLVRTLSQTGGL